MNKNLYWASVLVVFFSILHFSLGQKFQSWVIISWIVSFCLYGIFSIFLSSLFLYKGGKWWAGFFSLAAALPVLNFFYYKNYNAFIPSQLISALLREPLFLFSTLKMQLLPYAEWIVLVGLAFGTISCKMTSSLFSQRRENPFALLKKWFLWIPALILWLIQMKWCLKYDPHQLFIRSLYIGGGVGSISFLFFILKDNRPRVKYVFFVFLVTLVSFFILMGSSLKDKVSLMSLDAQFSVEVFNSVFSPSRDKSLKQSETAAQKYQVLQLHPPSIPFNVLILLNDAQRARNMGLYGYERYPDNALKSFYSKSYAFQALSPANFTDTAIPAVFTGQGPQRHPSAIKDALTLWDYFPKEFFTFYILTATKTWARLDEFFNSFNMQYVWSTVDEMGYNNSLDYIPDEIAIKELKKVLQNQSHFVGVFHANSMHFPYYQKEGFTPYQPCETTREHWPQASINCYDNALFYISSLEAELLNEINLDNTIVVIMSDHGEGFYEHGSYFHNQDLHEESIRVPFVWYIPPGIQQKIPTYNWNLFTKNQTRYVSTADLIPTILHLASLLTKQPPAFEADDFTGRSLFEDQTNRIVVSSGCFVDYRCFSRDVVFADENFFVLLHPGSLEPVEIYDAFDFNQQQPLSETEIQFSQLNNILSHASHIHPLGSMLTTLLSSELEEEKNKKEQQK